jgi:hypothetical protein
MFNLNLPQLDLIVKELIKHDERMAQLMLQISQQFAEALATMKQSQIINKPKR